jgi:hypothetical protein
MEKEKRRAYFDAEGVISSNGVPRLRQESPFRAKYTAKKKKRGRVRVPSSSFCVN